MDHVRNIRHEKNICALLKCLTIYDSNQEHRAKPSKGTVYYQHHDFKAGIMRGNVRAYKTVNPSNVTGTFAIFG